MGISTDTPGHIYHGTAQTITRQFQQTRYDLKDLSMVDPGTGWVCEKKSYGPDEWVQVIHQTTDGFWEQEVLC